MDTQPSGCLAAATAKAISPGDILYGLDESFGTTGDTPDFQVCEAPVYAGSGRISVGGEDDAVLVRAYALSSDLASEVVGSPGKPKKKERRDTHKRG
jgi:hypothetical protein